MATQAKKLIVGFGLVIGCVGKEKYISSLILVSCNTKLYRFGT